MMFKMTRLLLVVGMVAVLAGGCGILWDDEGSGPHPSYTSESGKLAQGYVKNAVVIADKIVSGGVGNCECDEGEICTLSDENGDFSLTGIDENSYGDYVLCTTGGTVTDAQGVEQPALPMLAPPGARNITMTTTLVAQSPGVEYMFGEHWDEDVASAAGADVTVMVTAKIVETILRCLSSSDAPLLTSTEDMLGVTGIIAEGLEDAWQDYRTAQGGTRDAAETRTALQAQGAAVSPLVVVGGVVGGITLGVVAFTAAASGDDDTTPTSVYDTIVAAINQAVEANANIIIQNTDSSTGKVRESVVQQTIEQNTATVTNTVAANTKTVNMSVTQVDAKNAGNTILASLLPATQNSQTVSRANASNITSMDFSLFVSNELLKVKTYTAYITATVTDSQSARWASAGVGPVTVTVSASNVVSLASATNTILRIKGKNADGSDVDATITNSSTSADPFSIAYVNSVNKVTVDLEAIGNKISNAVGPNSDLFDVGLPGVYTITLTATDVPLKAYSGKITVP